MNRKWTQPEQMLLRMTNDFTDNEIAPLICKLTMRVNCLQVSLIN